MKAQFVNSIWVTAAVDMIHHYPLAPAPVDFLMHPHRHLFKFKVWIEVKHDDREIEFLMFKQLVEGCLSVIKQRYNKSSLSCEMISDELYRLITKTYDDRTISIEVSEDGENGSYKTYPV